MQQPGFSPFGDIDTYQTNHAVPGRIILAGWRFNSGFLRVVIQSSLKAKYGTYTGRDWVRSSQRILKQLEAVGVRFDITGLCHLADTTGPSVIIGNHMSTLETMVLPCLVQPRCETTFVVKQELLSYPFFKHVLGARNPIQIGRENPREDLRKVLLEGQAQLQDGTSVILFPQRMGTSQFHPEEFNLLGVKLAQRANVPVIPVALAIDAWGNCHNPSCIGSGRQFPGYR